jgi:hypothetical protein
MALLKILALGMRQVEEGDIIPANEAIKRVRKRRLAISRPAIIQKYHTASVHPSNFQILPIPPSGKSLIPQP